MAYRDLDEMKKHLTYYLGHPDEARAIGQNALKRALRRAGSISMRGPHGYPTGAAAFPNTLLRRLWLMIALIDV